MNTKQKIRLSMYLAVRNYVGQNDTIADSIPKFAENYTSLLGIVSEIQAIGEIQGINRTGLTISKNKLKQGLILLAAKYSRKIAAFAKFSNDDKLLNEIQFNESDLERVPEVILIEQVRTIYNGAEANIGSLAEHGITPDTQKEFLSLIDSFDKVLRTPRTSALENMDFAAGIVKDEQPGYYDGYKSSRKLVCTNTGNVALKAKVVDILTGEPLKGAVFTFRVQQLNFASAMNPAEITRKSAAKGSLLIRSMQPGTYQVSVNKPGYKDKVVVINVTGGERTILNVEMERA
jgi:hypothetical protein